MTEHARFEKISDRPTEQLWNVTLLPLPSARNSERGTKLLENLDERRRGEAVVAIPPSFESQPRAVGW